MRSLSLKKRVSNDEGGQFDGKESLLAVRSEFAQANNPKAFLSVFFHEVGHYVLSKFYGYDPEANAIVPATEKVQRLIVAYNTILRNDALFEGEAYLPVLQDTTIKNPRIRRQKDHVHEFFAEATKQYLIDGRALQRHIDQQKPEVKAAYEVAISLIREALDEKSEYGLHEAISRALEMNTAQIEQGYNSSRLTKGFRDRLEFVLGGTEYYEKEVNKPQREWPAWNPGGQKNAKIQFGSYKFMFEQESGFSYEEFKSRFRNLEHLISYYSEQVVPSVTVDVLESRDKANAAAWQSINMSDLKVVTLVGVEERPGAEDKTMAQPILSKINADLKNHGYNGDRTDNQQVMTFKIIRNNDGTIDLKNTKQNMYDVIDSLYAGDNPVIKDPLKAMLAVFAPQMPKSELENDEELNGMRKDRNVVTILDSYSDSSLNPDVIKAKERGQKINTFIDIKSRVIIARLLAFCRERERLEGGKDMDSLKTLIDYLASISDNKDLDVANNLNELLNKLNDTALRIRPIDYTKITDWQKSQEATGISA